MTDEPLDKGEKTRNRTRTAKPKVNKAELIAQVIRHEIALGLLPIGAELPTEADIAARFQASRPVHREALRVLESEGLIKVARGARGGARVVAPDISPLLRSFGVFIQRQGADLADLHDLVRIVGQLAMRDLASCGDKSYLRAMAGHVAAQGYSLNSVDAFLEHEKAINELIFVNCQNSILALIGNLLLQIYQCMAADHNVGFPPNGVDVAVLRKGVRAKERVLDALGRGDADQAARSWTSYVDASFRLMTSALGKNAMVEIYSSAPAKEARL